MCQKSVKKKPSIPTLPKPILLKKKDCSSQRILKDPITSKWIVTTNQNGATQVVGHFDSASLASDSLKIAQGSVCEHINDDGSKSLTVSEDVKLKDREVYEVSDIQGVSIAELTRLPRVDKEQNFSTFNWTKQMILYSRHEKKDSAPSMVSS